MLYNKLIVILVAVAAMVSSNQALAYSPTNTHRWLSRQAVLLLVERFPGEYDELLEYVDDIVEGSYHEDDILLDGDGDATTMRVMRHFYHAPDRRGLSYGDTEEFPNSYEWNVHASAENEWDVTDGFRAYQEGRLADAMFVAGHTMHLLQDLTVPAHSHLDIHGPPFGDDYEQYCASRSHSPTEADLPGVTPDMPFPNVISLEELWQMTADASYYRNLFPGQLPEEGDASGVFAEMFPDLTRSWISRNWTIPGVGGLGAAFFAKPVDSFYVKKSAAHSAVDIVDYDPKKPLEREFGEVVSESSIAARMADDLIPVAILHSAAGLKLFVDQARALPSIDGNDMHPDEPAPAATSCSAAGTGGSSLFPVLLLACAILMSRKRMP